MLKKLYFCETNGYNMAVSVDDENNCRYLAETDDFRTSLAWTQNRKNRPQENF